MAEPGREHLDLDFDDAQQAIGAALAAFCADRCDDDAVKATAGRFPASLWSELCALGVLGAAGVGGSADDAGEGGALEMCAAMEALGRVAFPGPLAASFLAARVLPEAEAQAIVAGRLVVSAGALPLLPWAADAQIHLALSGDAVHRLASVSILEPVETLGGEPWARCRAERAEALPDGAAGLALYEIALASYLTAAGESLCERAAEHASQRHQFGRAIGEFQAVAHPLADCSMRLSAARTLARAAAWRFDRGEAVATRVAAATARLSAGAAALDSAYTSHQVFGALGVTLEGPVYHISRRIRQLVSLPPGEGAARERVLESIGLSVA